MARRNLGSAIFEKRRTGAPPIVLSDYETKYWDPAQLIVGASGRDPSKQAAALAECFCTINEPILRQYNVSVNLVSVHSQPKVQFTTNENIGAFPLFSPTTGKAELAGVIEPWIKWQGLGSMMSIMGWKIVPSLQKLPCLPRSAREVPSWVISSVVISRIEKLLDDIVRKYEIRKEDLKSPRGRIDWQEYAIKKFSKFDALSLPCEFPSLEPNQTLMGVVHYTLRKLEGELSGLRRNGSVVIKLLDRLDALLKKVSGYSVIMPTPRLLNKWFYSAAPSGLLDAGLEAMRWCAEDRGLGGLSDLNGLPWKMNMADFFEAYVETIVKKSVVYCGGLVKTDRINETTIPIAWQTLGRGSLKSLKPDIIVRRNNQTVIVDAKFKRYGMELRQKRWGDTNEDAQNEHRHDLHQVIAYSSCFTTESLVSCLVYPCTKESYENRLKQGNLHIRGRIRAAGRNIDLILTWVPLVGNIDFIAREFAKCFVIE